jgi:4-carboxymuconolactone decarboxylase
LARIPYPDPSDLPEDVRAFFEGLAIKLNIHRMMAGAPTCLRGYLSLGSAILRKQALDSRLRELAILRVAALSPSSYERTQHVPIAKACGATDADISAIEGGDPSRLYPRAALVLRFTDECVRDVRVSDATFEEAKKLFSPREITELTLTIGFYMMTARFLETLAVDAEPPAKGMAELFAPGAR